MTTPFIYHLLLLLQVSKCCDCKKLTLPLLAPDPPGNLSEHTMISLSDYEEETLGSSTIRDTFIKEERRLICYDQVIYDDLRLELTETTGLGLVPDDPDNVVVVEPYYGDSVVFIIDDDGV